jgi:hypothetical protein
MTTLHDRLADLAEDSPPARPAPDLWDRGLRYRRRQRAGTAVVVAVAAVALVVLGSVTWLRSPAAVEQRPVDSPAALPDRLFAPSGWLPDTGGHPLGRIAAVIPADRASWTRLNKPQPVGVSATTGEYRFLDLPRLAGGLDHAWALSPDGRYVAYLYADGDLARSRYATGLALYDAETGRTRFHAFPGAHGIQVGPASNLTWAGDDTVAMAYSATFSPRSELGLVMQPLLVWNVHVEAPTVLPDTGPVAFVRGAGPGFAVVQLHHRLDVVDTTIGAVIRDIQTALRGSQWSFDPTAGRFAFAGGQRGENVTVATFARDPAVQPTYRAVPGSAGSLQVEGWVDGDHISVLQRGEGQERRVASLDAATGATSSQVSFDADDVGDVEVATDLLAEPTVPGLEPPRPVDPRAVTGLGVVTVLVAGLALIAWRRRVRP